jgi:hypothetical protein
MLAPSQNKSNRDRQDHGVRAESLSADQFVLIRRMEPKYFLPAWHALETSAPQPVLD